jgi:hypothetical protein
VYSQGGDLRWSLQVKAPSPQPSPRGLVFAHKYSPATAGGSLREQGKAATGRRTP